MALSKAQKSLKKWTAQKWDYLSAKDTMLKYKRDNAKKEEGK